MFFFFIFWHFFCQHRIICSIALRQARQEDNMSSCKQKDRTRGEYLTVLLIRQTSSYILLHTDLFIQTRKKQVGKKTMKKSELTERIRVVQSRPDFWPLRIMEQLQSPSIAHVVQQSVVSPWKCYHEMDVLPWDGSVTMRWKCYHEMAIVIRKTATTIPFTLFEHLVYYEQKKIQTTSTLYIW